MCGIFGVIPGAKSQLQRAEFADQVQTLMRLSQSRGQDASGLAAVRDETITVCKAPIAATKLWHTPEVKKLFLTHPGQQLPAVIGHARMATKGSELADHNNQPIVRDGIVMLHNGIVVNDDQLWQRHSHLSRSFEVDTEIACALLRKYVVEMKSVVRATRAMYQELEGSASFSALFAEQNLLLLSTNTGSLYLMTNVDTGTLYFASERYFLETLIRRQNLPRRLAHEIIQLNANTGCIIDLNNPRPERFDLRSGTTQDVAAEAAVTVRNRRIMNEPLRSSGPEAKAPAIIGNSDHAIQRLMDMYQAAQADVAAMRRCTRCILPATMPFITFDARGVCSYCQNDAPASYQSRQDLEKMISPYRRPDGRPDCIVPFSGGRDSSYGLHVAVKELGLHPVAFSYDWGMLTDLGRRNQARLCGALGVEHVLISADIRQKRKNIRQNVLAWLRRPHLGTVPLFMAGDKQYFSYINKLQRQMRLPLALYLENRLEKTDFKSGFAGILPHHNIDHGYNLGFTDKLKLAGFYGRQFLRNPALLNDSMADTVSAFVASYVRPHRYVFLYQFIPWDEQVVSRTIQEKYNWETSPDIPTTWRIGDGTAPFYDFIYYLIAGFTENDTFRSNQIRASHMTRDQALERIAVENKPATGPIQWYCQTIGVDLNYALDRIGAMKKYYWLAADHRA